MEQEIQMQTEPIIYTAGGGAVDQVNGYTGVVVLTTSDLENTSDYQTGSEVESAISTAIAGKQDTLTAGSNITIASDNTISATDTTYSAGTGLNLNGTSFSVDYTATQAKLTAGSNVTISGDTISATDTTYSAFTGTDGTAAGVAGLVPAPETTDAGKYLKADGTWDTVSAGPTVVQTTGTSTTDVMSQNATTSMIYADPGSMYRVRIGNSASVSNSNTIAIGVQSEARYTRGVAVGNLASATGTDGSTAIGSGATSAGSYSTAIGSNASASSDGATALGRNASASAVGAVAIGRAASASQVGEMNIGSTSTSYGYNSSNYRLLTGVYDGQSAHDAVTVAQGNTLATSAPTTATVGVLGQLYTDTTNMHTYQCTAINGSEYTWTQRW